MAESAHAAPKRSTPVSSKKPVRRIEVQDLMGGAREAVLLHEHEEYRLRLTSNGKLILTK